MIQKKALQLASVASMIDQFNIPNIKILIELGYKVDVVADFTHPGNITTERCKELKKRLYDMGVGVYDIAIPRSLNFRAIINAYRQVKHLITTEKYSLIHCHSPIGGVICRQAAKSERKKGTRVIYTAHGFHFYDGAPLKNWIVFYPIEKWFSRYTDVLITINKEDYKRASEKFHAKKTVYVPGIGVDTKIFAPGNDGREKIRTELGLLDSKTMILSVGELNENKNHISVIKAIKELGLVYVIVGKGEKKYELEKAAKDNSVDLRLMGYRNDVADFYKAADVYVLPSIREGLNVSLMEAMATGLPVAAGNIRGNRDLVDNNEGLFEPTSIDEIKSAIKYLLNADKKIISAHNIEKIKNFDKTAVNRVIYTVYGEL